MESGAKRERKLEKMLFSLSTSIQIVFGQDRLLFVPETGNWEPYSLSTSYDKLLRRQATTAVLLRKARHLAWQEERHGTNKGRQMGSSNFHPNCTSFPRRRARASFLLLLERRRRLCLFSLQNGDGVSSAGLGRVRQTSIPNMINGGNQYAHRCCLKVQFVVI